MRKTGHSDEEIATLLDIPLEKVSDLRQNRRLVL